MVASLVVLFISFGTLLLAGLPLVTAILGVAIGLSAISALTAVTEINSVAPTLATMLRLAVGIDYAGCLLTIAASLGAVVWIFQEGNLADLLGVASTGPIVSFLPVLMIAILFGLAMDYEVFLVSRMGEG